MNLTLFVTVLITAVMLVVAALGIALLISPRSFNKQKGEAYVHGFTLAMTSQCKFYRPISELDNDGGYADIFLLPLCDIYKDIEDSYIVELKYCKPGTSDEQLNHLFEEASAQIRRYANSDIVHKSVKTTKLHQLVVIYRGAEMAMCEEVE